MAFRLIPREEKFFADFLAMADELQKGARLLEEMLAAEKPIWDKADEIKEVEHKCDFVTHEIIQRLNRTFVTPIDREDIHELARSLDDVMDAIDASATVVRLYRLDSVRFGARELAKVISASTVAIRQALSALSDGGKSLAVHSVEEGQGILGLVLGDQETGQGELVEFGQVRRLVGHCDAMLPRPVRGVGRLSPGDP